LTDWCVVCEIWEPGPESNMNRMVLFNAFPLHSVSLLVLPCKHWCNIAFHYSAERKRLASRLPWLLSISIIGQQLYLKNVLTFWAVAKVSSGGGAPRCNWISSESLWRWGRKRWLWWVQHVNDLNCVYRTWGRPRPCVTTRRRSSCSCCSTLWWGLANTHHKNDQERARHQNPVFGLYSLSHLFVFFLNLHECQTTGI
jgi:hypothetical protein